MTELLKVLILKPRVAQGHKNYLFSSSTNLATVGLASGTETSLHWRFPIFDRLCFFILIQLIWMAFLSMPSRQVMLNQVHSLI